MLYLPRFDKETSDAWLLWKRVFQDVTLDPFVLTREVSELKSLPGYALNHVFDWQESQPVLESRRQIFDSVVKHLVANGKAPMSALRRYRQYITAEKEHGS